MLGRRTLIRLALVATVTLTGAASALATKTGQKVGSFDAEGTGMLVAQGTITAFGKIEGSIVVRDPRGRAVVKVNGRAQRPKIIRVGRRVFRVYTVRKANGSYFVRGRDIRLQLVSGRARRHVRPGVMVEPLSISLFGRGAITRLKGKGIYHVNGGDERQWADAIPPIAVKPPAPDPLPAVTSET